MKCDISRNKYEYLVFSTTLKYLVLVLVLVFREMSIHFTDQLVLVLV